MWLAEAMWAMRQLNYVEIEGWVVRILQIFWRYWT